jgi:hypothetical protein
LIYRKTPEGWTKIDAMRPPSRSFFLSPERFVHNGASYLVFLTQDVGQSGGAPADVWIAGIGPNRRFVRQVSDPADTSMIRMDPEVFITTQGPFVYYTEKDLARQTFITHRCATGL